MSLHYLTVQDVLWINFQLTKKVLPFRYADLEEATYYQYGYGQSQSLLPQAAKFLTGFIEKRPLAAGNEATALIACLGFLEINGYQVVEPNVATWLQAIERGEAEALAAIESAIRPDEHGHHGIIPDVRGKLGELLGRYGSQLDAFDATPA